MKTNLFPQIVFTAVNICFKEPNHGNTLLKENPLRIQLLKVRKKLGMALENMCS